MQSSVEQSYQKPEIRDLGTLRDLTLLQNKNYGPSDGYLFNGDPIMDVS
jgi:hypothetical protein